MTAESWTTVLTIAAGAQLAVLPGEKVQFIVAAFAARYRPAVVVAAAGTAFAGWTAIEVWVGSAVLSQFPAAMTDAITAGLFTLFAFWLWRARSADDGAPPQTVPTRSNGGVDNHPATAVGIPGLARIPADRFGGFLPIFVVMAVGEVGDKTQLITVALASQYPASPSAIWLGEMLAILPVTVVNAYVFDRFVGRIDLRHAHRIGATIFAFFAGDLILQLTLGYSIWGTLGDLVGLGGPL